MSYLSFETLTYWWCSKAVLEPTSDQSEHAEAADELAAIELHGGTARLRASAKRSLLLCAARTDQTRAA